MVFGALAGACNLSQEGFAPPTDQLFFPSALLADPGEGTAAGRWLYVVNSNSDLRFNGGALVAVDLKAADDDRRTGTWEVCPKINYVRPKGDTGPECCWDALDHKILNCEDSRHIDERATLPIGSFASAVALQTFRPSIVPPGFDAVTRRLLVAVRGNTSITTVDALVPNDGAAPVSLSCSDTPASAEGPAPCDALHMVTTAEHDLSSVDLESEAPVEVRLPEEPYALAVDNDRGKYLLVGHLRGGQISIVDLANAEAGAKPTLVGAFPSIFPADGQNNRGVTSFTFPAGVRGLEDQVLATSRYVPLASAFTIVGGAYEQQAEPRTSRTMAVITTGRVFSTGLAGSEVRGIQFVQDETATRAYVLQRVPPALVEFDMTADGGVVAATQVIETCSAPTFLRQNRAIAADAQSARLYVICPEAGQIYVVNPWAAQLVSIIDVGRGPAGLAFGPVPGAGPDPTRGYVVGFGSNNVSILDLAPGSPTENQVIQRIGFPRSTPR